MMQFAPGTFGTNQVPEPTTATADRCDSFNPKSPAWTTDGRRAAIFEVSPLAKQYPISAMLKGRDGISNPAVFNRLGHCRRSSLDNLTNTQPGRTGTH